MKWMAFAGVALGVSLGAQEGKQGERFAFPAKNPEIERNALEAHLGFLASDELRGREAFTEDALRAARYLEGALKHAGVPEVRMQPVPFERTSFEGPPELVFVDGTGQEHGLVYGAQFSVSTQGRQSDGHEFMVTHVRAGETVESEAAPDRALVFHGSSREWRAFRRETKEAAWGLTIHHQGARKERGQKRVARDRVVPAWGERSDPEQGPVAIKLYGDQTAWIESVERLRFDSKTTVSPHTEYNVVGKIQGVGTAEQPELAKEVIVISAHYDHIGVLPNAPEGADRVRNGADDDASGVAVLIEIAEALAAGPAPARTVVFLLACAEEKGILGTKYYVHAPTEPLTSIVCNLNLEMLGRPDPEVGGTGKLWLTGYERSTLGPAFEAEGIAVVADPRLEQSFFTRSDNIVFVEVGVVAQTLSSYNMHRDYHGVGDEIERIDFEHLTLCAQAALQATEALAQGRIQPRWNEGEPKGFLPESK